MEEFVFHRNYIKIREIMINNYVISLSAEVEAAVNFERSQSESALKDFSKKKPSDTTL